MCKSPRLGKYYQIQARWYEQVFDACTMEAMACRDGLKMAVQAGYQRVHLETDCLDVIQLWKRWESQRSIISYILEEIVELSNGLHEFSFSFVHRVCNKVAHVLAKQVSATHCLERWYVTPACVTDLVISEAPAGCA
jgi:ribonuclease HI